MKYLLESFDLLKFPLALLVVCIHTVGPELKTGFAVPCFFVMSGFFFFYNAKDVGLNFFLAKWKRRLSSLLVPYVLWILLYYVYMQLFETEKLSHIMAGKSFLAIFYDANNLGHIPLLGPFWYVRDLIKVCLITPVVYWAVKCTKGWIIVLLGALYILHPILHLNIPFFGNEPLFFFTSGAFLAMQFGRYSKRDVSLQCFFTATIIGCLLYIGAYQYDSSCQNIFEKLYVVCGVLWCFSMAALVNKYFRISIPKWVSASSFYIYAVHMFFYTVSFYLVSLLHLGGGTRMLATPLVIFLSISSYFILKIVSPKALAVLLGGRIDYVKK